MTVPDPFTIFLTGRPSGGTAQPIDFGECCLTANHLGQLFETVALNRSTQPALTANSHTWTYADLLSAARTIASTLQSSSHFRPGDRVLIVLPNSAEYIAGFYGALLAGGVAVPIPPKAEAGLIRSIIESTESTVAITDQRIATAQRDVFSGPQFVVELDDSSSLQFEPEKSSLEHTGNELAAIFFTGGSSGQPKGVMLSHRNLISNAQSIQQYLQITSTDRPLCVLPFHHAFGNSVVQSHLLAGAYLIIDGMPQFPETIVEALLKHRCTTLSGVPDLFRLLLERSSIGKTALPDLRYLAVAGGALRHDLVLEMVQRISPAKFFVMYGQTEATARLAFLPTQDLEQVSAGCIGQAIPGVTLEIVDDQAQPVGPGVTGELRATGDNVMLGYWKDPAATSDRIRSGWLYTGDLASRDASGLITIRGRNSSFVKIAGYRVQPTDLEDFAVRRLAAAQAVVVPCDLPDVGTRLALYVRPKVSSPDLTLAEMVARCRAELPRYMVPEFIQFVDEFPLNSALKIDRPLLQRWAEDTKSGSRRTLA